MSPKYKHHIMKIKTALLCVCVLAAGLPVTVLGQANYATPYTFTTLAGYTRPANWDGTGSAAQFSYLLGVAVDTTGNVYVADHTNRTIRKVTPAGTDSAVRPAAGPVGKEGSTRRTA